MIKILCSCVGNNLQCGTQRKQIKAVVAIRVIHDSSSSPHPLETSILLTSCSVMICYRGTAT